MDSQATDPSDPLRSRIRGCLLGGAVGDALGAPVEFMSIDAIREIYGAEGVTGNEHPFRGHLAITDDTQMTLFTAEGVIRAAHRGLSRAPGTFETVLHNAYRRWMVTQGYGWHQRIETEPCSVDRSDSWLLREEVLHARRAPGGTCVRYLLAENVPGRAAFGRTDAPTNESKGCGGVMRVAPIGLATDDPFRLACKAAAITHGHPTGWLAAGAFAEIVWYVADGATPRDAALRTLERNGLTGHAGHEETSGALRAALALANGGQEPCPELVEMLGRGWVADEALAIGLYCALVARDFRHGVLLAVNHSGDSDSTASICGNLLGALLGEEAIPEQWLDDLEARTIIEQLADDLAKLVTDKDYEPDYQRYPPW